MKGMHDYGSSHSSHDGKKPKRIRKAVKAISDKRLKISKGGVKHDPKAQGTTAKMKVKTYVSLKGGKSAKIGMASEETKPVSKKQFTKLHSKKQMKNLKKAGRLMESKVYEQKGGIKRAKTYRG